jgi:hypothetical protein
LSKVAVVVALGSPETAKRPIWAVLEMVLRFWVEPIWVQEVPLEDL